MELHITNFTLPGLVRSSLLGGSNSRVPQRELLYEGTNGHQNLDAVHPPCNSTIPAITSPGLHTVSDNAAQSDLTGNAELAHVDTAFHPTLDQATEECDGLYDRCFLVNPACNSDEDHTNLLPFGVCLYSTLKTSLANPALRRNRNIRVCSSLPGPDMNFPCTGESCWLRTDLMFCLGPSSEMSIFCERSLEWIAEKTEDPSSMIALQKLKIAMSGHFKFSRIDDGQTLFKDRQLWPLPPSHIAEKYIAGNCRNPPSKSPLLTVT